MKKIYILPILILLLTFSLFSGCSNERLLDNQVCSLRSDIYFAESEDFSLQAFYGFEKNISSQKNSNEKIYSLTFRIIEKNKTLTNCSIRFSYNNEEYSSDFKLDPISNILSAKILVNDFNQKSFSVVIIQDSNRQEIQLVSKINENALNYQKALSNLYKKQENLIKAYIDEDGNFTADIHMRILVKNQKTYWYVGLVKNSSTKALLLDASTGETLAIRDVF